MKKLKWTYKLGFVAILLLVMACNSYYTINLDPEESKTIKRVNKREIAIIHTADNNADFILKNFNYDGETLIGIVSKNNLIPLHKPGENKFKTDGFSPRNPYDLLHVYTSLESIEEGSIEISKNQIKHFDAHLTKVDTGEPILNIILILIAISLVLGLGLFALVLITCGCPQVSTVTTADILFHGSLFPGAIMESFERNDHLILHDALVDPDGTMKVRVANELPETQYLDELSVIQVKHPGYEKLGVDQHSDLVAFNQILAPIQKNDDFPEYLKSDQSYFQFDDENKKEKLNELQLQFDRKSFQDSPMLFIRGKQTSWLDTVASIAMAQSGKNYDRWISKSEKRNVEKWRKKNVERGVALNVYLKHDGQWNYAGSHHDAGTQADRDLFMELDIRDVSSKNIEIKLESAYRIWEIDQVGLTSDWSKEIELNRLESNQVLTNEGEDVAMELSKKDKRYHVQSEYGSFIEMHVHVPAYPQQSTLVLKGNGYFHKDLDMDHPINLGFFYHLRKKMGLQKLSVELAEYFDQHNVVESGYILLGAQ